MKNLLFMTCISLVVALMACDGAEPIGPDSTSGSGGATSSATTSSSSSSSSSSTGGGMGGEGGAGGGLPGAGGGGGAGGGNLPCDPCINHDGARIVARHKVTDMSDGLHWEDHIGWYDTQFKIGCDQRLADDGQLRCLPAERLLKFPVQVQKVVYMDPLCKDQIIENAAGSACSDSPMFAVESLSTQVLCAGSMSRMYALGGPWNPTLVWTKTSAGQCIETSASPNGYYILGAQIPPSEFVLMTQTTIP